MSRYWVSWWTDQVFDGIPWTCWITGERFNVSPRTSLCAVIDAGSENIVWRQVGEYFPDNERRFIVAKPADWTPGDRFQ